MVVQELEHPGIGERIERPRVLLREVEVLGQAGRMSQQVPHRNGRVGEVGEVGPHGFVVAELALFLQLHDHQGNELLRDRCQIKG